MPNPAAVAAIEFVVSDQEAGQRLDVVLVRRVEGMSRARARRLTEDGKVRVNDRRARKGRVLAPGDRVALDEVPPKTDFAAEPDPDLPLRIAYEDDHLVVVDKDAGVPSHPLRPDEKGTVASAIVARYPETAVVGYSAREPGIVHRLDTDTSGLLVVARSVAAFEALKSALREGRFDKRYLALCAGRIAAPRTIDLPIASHPSDPRRVVACVSEADIARLHPHPAETELLRAEPRGAFTLVEVRARSARRHQIRAHLAALGHPLAGDRLYGGPEIQGLERHFLHAGEIAFPHPVTGAIVGARAPLPRDLEAALDAATAGA